MLQKIKKNKKNFFILISVLVLLVAIPLFIRLFHDDRKPLKRYLTDEISEKDADINIAIDVVSPSSTKIESGDYMGSGNIWAITGKNIKIVTASHVAAEDNCTITFFDGATCEGTVTFRDDVKDIALIEVDRASINSAKNKESQATLCAPMRASFSLHNSSAHRSHPCGAFLLNREFQRNFLFNKKDVASYRSVRPSKELPDCEEQIFIIDTLTNTASMGIVDTPSVFNPMIGHDVIYCMCDVEEGMSGSGLFDATGEYHGILLQKSDGACICLPVSDFNLP